MAPRSPWQRGFEPTQLESGSADSCGMRLEPSAHVDAIARAVIGAAIEVHRHLGPGFLASIYLGALRRELELRNLRVEPEAPADVIYKDALVGAHRIDLLVERELIVELKAVEAISSTHLAQVLSYLKARGLPLGLILNFRAPVMKQGIKRVVLGDRT